MKKILVSLIALFSLQAFADSGFSQLQKLFNEGQALNLAALKFVDQGLYVGRCFKDQNTSPFGAAVAFKNTSQDSGPIAVDPELYVGFNWTQQSNYFDQVDVKYFLEKLTVYKAEKIENDISYAVALQSWWFLYRANGEYIIQKNIVQGTEDSYCYYYSFRQK